MKLGAWFALLLLLFGVEVFSQESDLFVKYKDQVAVYTDRSETLVLSIVGDSLKARSEISSELFMLKEAPESYYTNKIYGSYFSEISELKAKTLIPDKGKYKSFEVKEFKRNTEVDEGIFFNDSYNITYQFPGAIPGSKLQTSYTETLRDPRMISGFHFSHGFPQVKARYVIKAPTTVDLQIIVLNDPEKSIQYTKTEKGNTVIHEWSISDTKPYRGEASSPSASYYTPQVICYVKSYKVKNETRNLLNNLDDLYAWYKTFLKNLNGKDSDELIAITKSLKDKSVSEEDFVKLVFYWVQENIRYVAFEDGMRGLIPHPGGYVCEKRFGDCKDMASIIVDMLRIGGVKGYYTWVGTRDLPYKYSTLPTPYVDNHMIATYINPKGEYIYLDGTGDHTPYGYPSSMIQGKEVLIAINDQKFEIQTVPVIASAKNVMLDTVTIQWKGTEVAGIGKIVLNGFPKVFNGYRLDRSNEKKIKDYVTSLTSKGSNKYFLDTYNVVNVVERDLPTAIDYTFHIGDYVQKIGEELYVNLNLNKDFYNEVVNIQTRKSPIENEYQYEKVEIIDFKIPEGYKPEYIPPDQNHLGTLLGFKFDYEVYPDKIRLHKTLSVNYLLMHPDQFQAWNKEVKALSESYRESVILKKK